MKNTIYLQNLKDCSHLGKMQRSASEEDKEQMNDVLSYRSATELCSLFFTSHVKILLCGIVYVRLYMTKYCFSHLSFYIQYL